MTRVLQERVEKNEIVCYNILEYVLRQMNFARNAKFVRLGTCV
jgi:hypothetical protein